MKQQQCHEVTYKVLAAHAYYLMHGEDDEMLDRTKKVLDDFIEHAQIEGCPEGYTFTHYECEPENHSEDYGQCEATESSGGLTKITFHFKKD